MSVDQAADDVRVRQMSVEQILIATAADGPFVAATSLSDPTVAKAWLGALLPLLHINSGPSTESLAFIRFTDNWAVLLRQQPDSAGRPLAHALVGKVDLLSAGLALTLSSWPGWLPVDHQTYGHSLCPEQLRQELDVAGSLRATAIGEADRLAQILGWLLENPAAPLTVLGCPDRERVALLWALAELGAPVCPGRPWTFWTEAHGPTDWWPDIVFLSARPDDPGDRLLVDLDKEQWPDPAHATVANQLVYRLKYGQSPGAPAVPGPRTPDSAVDHVSPQAPAREPDHMPPMVMQRAARIGDVLVGSGDAKHLAVAVAELEQAAGDPVFRWALRRVLTGTDYGVSHVKAVTAHSRTPHVLERVVRLLFGPELVDLDTLHGVEQAGDLVRCADADLVAVLARHARKYGRLRTLTPALGARWATDLDADPARGPIVAAQNGVGRMLGARSSRGQQRALMTATVALLVLVAAAAFLVGRTTAGTAPAPGPIVASVTTIATAPTGAPATQDQVTQPPAPQDQATQPPAAAGAAQASTVGSFADESLTMTGTAQYLRPTDTVWLLAERTATGAASYYLDPTPCTVTGQTWTCMQSARLPKPMTQATGVAVAADKAATATFTAAAKESGGTAAPLAALPHTARELARTPA